MEQITLGKAVLWLFGFIPAALGALLSLVFRREPLQIKNEKLAKVEPLISFLFGVSIAYFFGGACIEKFQIPPESFSADSIKVALGLFGIGTLTEAMKQIPLAITALRKKFLGE
jgi:hypothetical protein